MAMDSAATADAGSSVNRAKVWPSSWFLIGGIAFEPQQDLVYIYVNVCMPVVPCRAMPCCVLLSTLKLFKALSITHKINFWILRF